MSSRHNKINLDEICPWTYQGKKVLSLEDCPKGAKGFVYRIDCPDGSSYVGKKSLYSYTTQKNIEEHQDRLGRARKRTVKTILAKESTWKKYFGSNPDFAKKVKEENYNCSREILCFAFSKKQLTYYENKYLYMLGVIEPGNERYFNDNIEARHFRKDFYISQESSEELEETE